MRNDSAQWWQDTGEHHPPTQRTRAQLAAHIADFHAKGRAITEIPAGVIKGFDFATAHENGGRNIVLSPERDARRDMQRDAA